MSVEPVQRITWALVTLACVFLSACYEVENEIITPELSSRVPDFDGKVIFRVHEKDGPHDVTLLSQYIEEKKEYSIKIKSPEEREFFDYGVVRAFNLTGDYFIFQLTRNKMLLLFIVQRNKRENLFNTVWIDWQRKEWSFQDLKKLAEQHEVKLEIGLIGERLAGEYNNILQFLKDHQNLPLSDFAPPPEAPCGSAGPVAHYCPFAR